MNRTTMGGWECGTVNRTTMEGWECGTVNKTKMGVGTHVEKRMRVESAKT